MITPDQHRRQAEHNRAFIGSLDLDITTYLDWAVTAAFYAALHLVEWFLTSRGHTGRRSHQLRDAYISREADLKATYGDYTELKYQSEGARYECFRFTPDEVKSHILPLLDEIQTHIASRLT